MAIFVISLFFVISLTRKQSEPFLYLLWMSLHMGGKLSTFYQDLWLTKPKMPCIPFEENFALI